MEATLQEDLGPINLLFNEPVAQESFTESMSMEDLVSSTDREYGSTSVHVATSDYFYSSSVLYTGGAESVMVTFHVNVFQRLSEIERRSATTHIA
jgi:hypothetical protein